ncbi:MAG: outer membrane protein transport protein [Planctomycetota bacterium]|nr:outer membrane protein transport protein [Planctomycetota bacterium]
MAHFRTFRYLALLCLFGLASSLTVVGQGIYLPAAGAVNRGMAGATTGTAIDAIGSMYWNPATIGQLPTDELAFGFEAIYSTIDVASSFPGAGSGFSNGENGVSPIPTIAWVHHTNNPNVTVGLGLLGVGGFGTNVRADATNPILSPPSTLGGVGIGGVRSDAVFSHMKAALSVRINDQLSIGGGPIVGLGKVTLDENILVGLNADGTYPRGDGTRNHWGLGAELGFHFVPNCRWEFGGNIKTPTWFEPLRYFSEDAAGLRRTDKVDFMLPMVLSGGVAFKGIEFALITVDVRYFDYTSADTLGDAATYEADFSVAGLGWKDVFSVAIGAQLQLTERLTGRLGYMYASDLIDDSTAFFNIASNLSYRRIPTIGATYQLNEGAALSVAYNYVTPWRATGPYTLPGVGQVPGSSVTTELNVHIATLGINVRY